jgi:hypothetical protein
MKIAEQVRVFIRTADQKTGKFIYRRIGKRARIWIKEKGIESKGCAGRSRDKYKKQKQVNCLE